MKVASLTVVAVFPAVPHVPLIVVGEIEVGVSPSLDTSESLFPVTGLKNLLKMRVWFATKFNPKRDALAVTGTFVTEVSTRRQISGAADCRATVSVPLTVPRP